MFSVLFLFGRRGVAPMVGGMMLTNEWNFHLPLPQAMVLLFCQTFPVLLVCAIVRWQLGARWRYGIPNQGIWLRVFWLGLMTPFGIKSVCIWRALPGFPGDHLYLLWHRHRYFLDC